MLTWFGNVKSVCKLPPLLIHKNIILPFDHFLKFGKKLSIHMREYFRSFVEEFLIYPFISVVMMYVMCMNINEEQPNP